MTTMKIEELIKIGFNKNEAKVYFSLIKFGKTDANQIIKDTKFHKNIVYDNLEKLIDKGLVTYIIEDGKRVYKIASSHMLIQFFEEQKDEIEKKKEIATKIAKEINKIEKNIPRKREATIFKGIKGIKSFYNETLNNGDFVAFGAPQSSIDTMGEHFWENYILKRKSHKIKARLIFNPSIKSYGEHLKNEITEIRYFDKEFEPLTETHIQGEIVAVIVWSEEPILFLIRDKLVADSYLKFFEKMWKVANP